MRFLRGLLIKLFECVVRDLLFFFHIHSGVIAPDADDYGRDDRGGLGENLHSNMEFFDFTERIFRQFWPLLLLAEHYCWWMAATQVLRAYYLDCVYWLGLFGQQ